MRSTISSRLTPSLFGPIWAAATLIWRGMTILLRTSVAGADAPVIPQSPIVGKSARVMGQLDDVRVWTDPLACRDWRGSHQPSGSQRRSAMPQYLYQLAYTAESLAAQMKNPQDRLELVGKQLAETV